MGRRRPASALTGTLAEQTGAPLDRAGRIGVNPDLTLPGYPEVFVVGDMIALDNLPGVAQVAIQGAKYAAKTIEGRLEGKKPLKAFKYFDKGSMATISRFRAVALIGRFRLTGFVAWLMWLAVHLVYITGFKNRVTAVLHWLVSFLGRGRSERTATEQQIFGRSALQRLEHGASDLVSPPDADQVRRLEQRRAELEALALEEARLTDAGERGANLGPRGSLEVARRLAGLLLDRLARPPGQDHHALGLDGHAVRTDDVRLGEGLDALDAVDPALDAQVAERRPLAVAQRERPGHARLAAGAGRLAQHLVEDERRDAAVHEPGRPLVGGAEVEVGPDVRRSRSGRARSPPAGRPRCAGPRPGCPTAGRGRG